MTKKYYLLTLCVLFLSFIGASAQDNGYYRLQNVASEHIAQLSGHTHVAPSATLEQAVVLPGTIAYTAVENNHFTALTIQNVDLVNQVIPMVKDIAANLFDEEQFASLKDTLEHYVLSYMSANVADLVVPLIRKYTYQDFQKYIANADGNLYLEPADENSYYLYVNTPVFPLNAGILNSYLTTVANEYLDLLRKRATDYIDDYTVGREYLRPIAYSLAQNIYFADRLYLVEQNDDTFGPQFGFANSTKFQAQGKKAMWNMVPVDEENYLGVEGVVKDNEDTWFSSIALGFPVRLAEGMKAYYLTDDVDAKNSEIVKREISDDVIPAMTPVILKLNGAEPALNKLTPVEPVTNVVTDNTLRCATDSLGFLMGFSIPQPDTRHYVLGKKEGKVCMVETTQTYFDANTPYYFLADYRKDDNTSGYLKFVDALTDGINSIPTTAHNDGFYYDLQGRRVSHPTSGIYIQNGKKVMIR